MLYLIGLGLGDEKDITLRGLEAVKNSSKVYLEAYTSILLVDKSRLEALYGKEVIVADREMVEQKAEEILQASLVENVAFLVVGDPFGATTHSDLLLRAKTLGVKVVVIHNASVLNAIGVCGLQLYRFGEVVSIPFFTETWRPDSFHAKIKNNASLGLHTLCLLDIRVKEPSMEALCRGRKEYEPPRYMSVNIAIKQLLEVADHFKDQAAYDSNTICIGVARLGTDSECLIAGSMSELRDVDFGPPLHSLIITGDLHIMEKEILQTIMVSQETKRIEVDVEENDTNYLSGDD